MAWGEEERESERRPAASADHARSNAPGLGSFDGPVVGEPARLLPLLLDDLDPLTDPDVSDGLDDLGGVGTGDVLLGGSQTVFKEAVTGIVMRA